VPIWLSNVWARVEDAGPDPTAVLQDLEREIPAGAPSLRGVDLQGAPVFLSGVADEVSRRLQAPVVDCRSKMQSRPVNADGLRHYQVDAAQAALTHTRGLISMPTGSGKTITAAKIIEAVPLTWLYLAHRTTLVEQSARVFEEVLKEPVGRVADGSMTLARVTCATYASMRALMAATMKSRGGAKSAGQVLLAVEGLVVDEVHRIACDSAFDIVSQMENAYFRIGLGATNLLRGDGKNMLTVGLLGPTIYEIGVPELVAQGYLAQGQVVWRACYHPYTREPWDELYGRLIAGGDARNASIIDLIADADPPMLVFVRELAHGRRLLERVTARFGPDFAAFVSGDTSTQERQQRVAELRAGTLKAIVATTVFEEGLDAPEIRSVVVASAGKSSIRAIQQMGRATRPATDKQGFTLYDVADLGAPALERHTWERAEAYRLTGYAVPDPLPARPSPPEPTAQSVRKSSPARGVPTRQSAYSVGASLAPEQSRAWSIVGTAFCVGWLVLLFMVFVWAPLAGRNRP
jgi:superfamily II DNA or RNA helicase